MRMGKIREIERIERMKRMENIIKKIRYSWRLKNRENWKDKRCWKKRKGKRDRGGHQRNGIDPVAEKSSDSKTNDHYYIIY